MGKEKVTDSVGQLEKRVGELLQDDFRREVAKRVLKLSEAARIESDAARERLSALQESAVASLREKLLAIRDKERADKAEAARLKEWLDWPKRLKKGAPSLVDPEPEVPDENVARDKECFLYLRMADEQRACLGKVVTTEAGKGRLVCVPSHEGLCWSSEEDRHRVRSSPRKNWEGDIPHGCLVIEEEHRPRPTTWYLAIPVQYLDLRERSAMCVDTPPRNIVPEVMSVQPWDSWGGSLNVDVLDGLKKGPLRTALSGMAGDPSFQQSVDSLYGSTGFFQEFSPSARRGKAK